MISDAGVFENAVKLDDLILATWPSYRVRYIVFGMTVNNECQNSQPVQQPSSAGSTTAPAFSDIPSSLRRVGIASSAQDKHIAV